MLMIYYFNLINLTILRKCSREKHFKWLFVNQFRPADVVGLA